MSRNEAAKRVGVSANTVARWESGKAIPTSERADSLRDMLGISRRMVGNLVRGAAPPDGAEETAARIAELEDRIEELEATCAQPVTSLEDQYGNAITLSSSGIRIESPSKVEMKASIVEIEASTLQLLAAVVTASGVLQAETVVTNAVVSASYTPGAGNIW